MLTGLHHVGYVVPDLDKASAFFTDTLGMTQTKRVAAPHMGLEIAVFRLGDHLDRLLTEIDARRSAKKSDLQQAMSGAWCAVLLARKGERTAALRDAEHCLGQNPGADIVYQLAGVYALTSKDHPDDQREAFRLLWLALKTGFGLDLVDADPDLDPVRKHPEFQRLVKSARALQPGPGR